MNSEFTIRTSVIFNTSIKKLYKKYPSLIQDLQLLKIELLTNPLAGVSLGKNCYKNRLKITSKQAGKSGGARVITYVKIEKKTDYFTRCI